MKNTKVCNFRLWLLAFNCVFLAFTPSGCNDALLMTSAGIDSLIPKAADIIRKALDDDDPRIRAKAIEVVADTKQLEFMPQVQRLLRDDFVPVRFAAAWAVGDMQYHPAKNTVERLLKAPDENSRIAAAYALTRLGSSDKLHLLHKALASSDQTARANAALLLGKTGDKTALEPLYELMKDKNSGHKVGFQAAEAIARLGDEQIYHKLWTMLISTYADDRTMGIKAMGALGTPKAKNALIIMLDDDILEVRLAAAEQLGRLKDTTGEAEVLDVFSKNLTVGLDKVDKERANVLTALAIGQIHTPALTKFLPRLLKDDSKRVRLAAAKAVFQGKTAN